MWYEWLIFGVIFLLIPIGIINIKIMGEKKIKPTEEQKKNANLTFGLLILFYWLCDLFYMAFILDSLALKFVFGGLIMIIIFMNLSKAFIGGKPQLKWGLVQDFIVGVGMSVYLIYIIPNTNLQNVVIPIVSAVYGGLITLVGVAWTIRKADIDRNEIERKQYKPFFVLLNVYDKKIDKDVTRLDFESKNDKEMFGLLDGYIQNLDFSHFIIEKIVIADTEYYPITNSVIEKNEIISLSVYGSKKEVQSALLYISDVLGYKYIYNMILETETPEHRCKCVEKCTLIREEKQ